VKIALFFFILIFFVYPLLEWFWGESLDAQERIEKDEKYSFKKMNAEINRRKNEEKAE